MPRAASLVLCLTAVLAGCVTPGSRGRPVDGGSFAQALRDCRGRQPGSLDEKLALPAERLAIRRCLAGKGWNPDGSPTLDAILRERTSSGPRPEAPPPRTPEAGGGAGS